MAELGRCRHGNEEAKQRCVSCCSCAICAVFPSRSAPLALFLVQICVAMGGASSGNSSQTERWSDLVAPMTEKREKKGCLGERQKGGERKEEKKERRKIEGKKKRKRKRKKICSGFARV